MGDVSSHALLLAVMLSDQTDVDVLPHNLLMIKQGQHRTVYLTREVLEIIITTEPLELVCIDF
jgi:hypothetical protein